MRPIRLSILLMLVLVLCVACSPKQTEATVQSVTVSSMQGDAQIQHTAKGQANTLREGQTLLAEDIITTGAGALVVVDMEGQKQIQIGENTIFALSAIRKDADGEVTILALKQGSIVNVVDAKLSEKDSFEVHTPRLVMSVRGTSNMMISGPEGDQVIGITGDTRTIIGDQVSRVVAGMAVDVTKDTVTYEPISSDALPALAAAFAKERSIAFTALTETEIAEQQVGASEGIEQWLATDAAVSAFTADLMTNDAIVTVTEPTQTPESPTQVADAPVETPTTPEVSQTVAPTPSATVLPSSSPTIAPTPKAQPTPTARPSTTVPPSPSITPSPSQQPSVSPSPSVAPTPSPTITPSPSATPSPTMTPSPSTAPSPTPITTPVAPPVVMPTPNSGNGNSGDNGGGLGNGDEETPTTFGVHYVLTDHHNIEILTTSFLGYMMQGFNPSAALPSMYELAPGVNVRWSQSGIRIEVILKPLTFTIPCVEPDCNSSTVTIPYASLTSFHKSGTTYTSTVSAEDINTLLADSNHAVTEALTITSTDMRTFSIPADYKISAKNIDHFTLRLMYSNNQNNINSNQILMDSITSTTKFTASDFDTMSIYTGLYEPNTAMVGTVNGFVENANVATMYLKLKSLSVTVHEAVGSCTGLTLSIPVQHLNNFTDMGGYYQTTLSYAYYSSLLDGHTVPAGQDLVLRTSNFVTYDVASPSFEHSTTRVMPQAAPVVLPVVIPAPETGVTEDTNADTSDDAAQTTTSPTVSPAAPPPDPEVAPVDEPTEQDGDADSAVNNTSDDITEEIQGDAPIIEQPEA